MRFFTKKRRNPVPIILPLIDILAILLIFFIVTTTFKKPAPRLQINLPESRTATDAPAEETEPVILQVGGVTEIFLDDRPVTIESLAAELAALRSAQPNRPIALQADKAAEFGVVVRVLDALKEAGIRNIPAFTEPVKAGPQTP